MPERPPASQLHPGTLLLVLALSAGCLVWIAHLIDRSAQAPVSPRIAWSDIAPADDAALRPWRSIVIHHTASSSGSSSGIDRHHKDANQWEGVGYHFVIGNGSGMPMGQIDATFRWYRQHHGAHAGVEEHNERGIGIVLIGNYESEPVPATQFERCAHLCALLIARFSTLEVERVIGHKNVAATVCPGRYFDLRLLHRRIQDLLPLYHSPPDPPPASEGPRSSQASTARPPGSPGGAEPEDRDKSDRRELGPEA